MLRPGSNLSNAMTAFTVIQSVYGVRTQVTQLSGSPISIIVSAIRLLSF